MGALSLNEMLRMGFVVLAILFSASCGGSSPPPGGSNPPPGGGNPIGANARLGWDQNAASLADVNQMRFGAYIDNTPRVDLDNVQCGGSTGPFQCSARMPSMSPGTHAVQLVAYVLDNGSSVESGRSDTLSVTISGATAGADASGGGAAHEQTTSDGLALRLDVVATGLQGATALAFSRDGLAIVAERRGRILVDAVANMRPGASLADRPAAIELDDVHLASPDTGGLMGLALDPLFERTRLVYALYTVEGRNASLRFRVARFREAGGRLGERAVILEGLPASPRRPAGAIAFGPDGRLYLAFDDGGNPANAGSPSTYSGKAVRLDPDGARPQDLESPVYETDLRSPRGFDWHPGSKALWLADVVTNDTETLRVRAADVRRAAGSPARDTMRLPQGTDPAAIAFARGGLLPSFEGDLFVASRQGRHLLRLRIDQRDPMRVVGTERLFAGVAGPLNSLVSGPDGALYLATDTTIARVGPR